MKRALVVVDVQNEYDSGLLRIEYPSIDDSLEKIYTAMTFATSAHIPIVLIQHLENENAPVFARGSHEAAIHSRIIELPYQVLIEKKLPSAFTNTRLHNWLQEHAIDTLSICGYMTQNCNFSTAVEAVHRGYQVEYLQDATGAVSYQNQAGIVSAETMFTTFNTVLQARFAAVLNTAAWIEHVQQSTTPTRSSILQSIHKK